MAPLLSTGILKAPGNIYRMFTNTTNAFHQVLLGKHTAEFYAVYHIMEMLHLVISMGSFNDGITVKIHSSININ